VKVTALAAVVLAIVAGCSQPVSRYQAIQDELAIPSDWQRVTETIMAPGTSTTCATILSGCPRVTRYFVVPGTPTDAYTQGRQFVAGAGFALDHDSPKCWPPPASPACGFDATRNADRVEVNAYNPGDHPDSAMPASDQTIVRVSAFHWNT
jgi:hypothetical protein